MPDASDLVGNASNGDCQLKPECQSLFPFRIERERERERETNLLNKN